MDSLPLFTAFFGGLVSFASPCVLPLIPGFIAYLAGVSLKESGSKRMDFFLNSLFFVLGFSLVFAALGVLLNTILSASAYAVQEWLAWIGGALMIFFGLYVTGLIEFPLLERQFQFSVPIAKASFGGKSSYATSLLFGTAFAAGWTPCVGIILGGILGLAATVPGVAFSLLFAYSLGLGLPFLLVGIFASGTSVFFSRYLGLITYLRIIFGMLLIALGILAFTQNLSLVANFGFLNDILLRQ